jgi:hypothetical protein
MKRFNRLALYVTLFAVALMLAPPAAQAHVFRGGFGGTRVFIGNSGFRSSAVFLDPSFGYAPAQVFLAPAPQIIYSQPQIILSAPVPVTGSTTTIERFGPLGNLRSVKQFNQ